MLLSFIVMTLVFQTINNTTDSNWSRWKERHSKRYSSLGEEMLRRRIFHENECFVRRHNAKYTAGLETYNVNLNHFSDLTPKEFADRYLMLGKDHLVDFPGTFEQFISISKEDPPSSFDWRQKGCITSVKDQGPCGSCWAFAVVGAVESLYAQKNGQLIDLSEQQIIDCDNVSWGCQGGSVGDAFAYTTRFGLQSGSSYPYMAEKRNCAFDQRKVCMKIQNHINVPKYDETQLRIAVAVMGPVVALLDASNPGFMHYSAGVYADPMCRPWVLNHALLVVGYGISTTFKYQEQKFWILKNSWGVDWGEDGYMRLARDQTNMCGVASAASYPI